MKRQAITLVELLITMLVISILAALILGVASVAIENGRRRTTEHKVQRLHQLLAEHMGSYKTRRVRLRPTVGNLPGVEDQINAQFGDGIRRGMAKAEARLYATREMLLMEVPDRWTDVALAPLESINRSNPVMGRPIYCEGRTALANVYARRLAAMLTKGVDIDTIKNNQGAECLYLVITLATGDGEARSKFNEDDIGDVDGDGAPEFLDAWGRPINFLRWAPGFDSLIQKDATKLLTPDEWRYAADFDHDPFDLYKVDRDAFRLVPLIYSPGSDESSGIVSREDYRTWPQSASGTLNFRSGEPLIASPRLLTCAPIAQGLWLGMPNEDGTSTDNIHNHTLGRR